MTLRNLATQLGVKTTSLQRKLKRKSLGKYGIDDELPEDVTLILKGEKPKEGSIPPVSQKKPVQPKKSPTQSQPEPTFIDKALALVRFLPLPMLGLPAAYGVYFFATHFAPQWVAMIEAAAFELVYIGLASMQGLSDKQKKYARNVSVGAVLVSVLYNTLASAFHRQPEMLDAMHPIWFWTLSIMHGSPLAILAYFMADLIFHQKK